MQSISDAANANRRSGGVKRAASPIPLLSFNTSAEHHQPFSLHSTNSAKTEDRYSKRLQVTHLMRYPNNHDIDSTSSQGAPCIAKGVTGHREVKIAEEVPAPNYEMSNWGDPKPQNGPHRFSTKASVETPRGFTELESIHVDDRCPFNLVPLSLATNLNLTLYSGKTRAVTIARHSIQSNQYCQFAIQVAGQKAMIDTIVIPGLQTILLGRDWIHTVHLLSDFKNQNYYIPVHLAVEVFEEVFLDISDTIVEPFMPAGIVTSGDISEELEDEDVRTTEYNSPSNRTMLDDDLISESKSSFHNGVQWDKHSPVGTLSDGEDSSGELYLLKTSGEDNDTDNGRDQHGYDMDDGDDRSCGFDEVHQSDEGKAHDQCDGCEECHLYNACDGCEECEGDEEFEALGTTAEETDRILQDLGKQQMHARRFEEIEQAIEAHLQQLESIEEPVPSSSRKISHEQPATASVEAPIKKHQSKEIASILNYISQTPAGQSFKAPVEQLWPEYAGAYAAKVANPIDLGTIRAKVKGNMYSSMGDFRADVALLYKNSVDFNGVDHIITSAALEVRDTIFTALSDMEEGKCNVLRSLTRSPKV
ncbi:hypothetical protein BKA65DRAFT_490165 [Rhexocercosporidium sp. MPI-PUGE-AT-0058]|nr:hypothetical protein BKA65DRAFT_490165 [Rhexocercosporidium sp. MPI-PUGE-AT-0058]